MRARFFAVPVCLAGAALLAQDQPAPSPPQSTFRGGVQFVRVDMYASRDSVPVTDLRPEDIELLEDGVPQRIVAFERIDIPSGGPEATRIEPNTIRAGQQAAADPRARVFVLFLDTFHMDAQAAQQASGPVRRFLEEALGPDDLVAVMMPEMQVADLTFTRRTSGIARILEQVDAWMLRDWEAATTLRPFTLDPTERLYEECYNRAPKEAQWMIARRREKRSLEALEELAVSLGLIREERKTVLVVTLGWPMSEPQPELAAKVGTYEQPIPSTAQLVRGRDREGKVEMSNVTVPNSTNAPLVCEADRYALANMDNRERMRDITGTANRANVSFYPITPMRTSPTSGGAVHLSYVRQMAEDSDGLAIVNTNNIAEPLRRVISDMSSYYLVGYESTNSTLDGRFRTIKVSVKRPNVQVRARKGYRATRAADVASSAAAKSSAPRADEPVARALTSVIGSATPVPLRLRASAWTRGTSGPEGFVWIVGEVDAATRREPGWSSGATAEIAVLGSNGAASERRTVTIGPGGFTFVARVPEAGTLPPDQYMVRVSLRSSGSGSTVADATTTTVPASASPLGEPLLLRRSPSTGTRYIETADQRFARNERLRVELPAASKDTAVARVVDRAGQTMKVPAQVSSRGDASGDFQWVVVDLALAPFAPGDYAVVVSLESAMQVIGFRVVP